MQPDTPFITPMPLMPLVHYIFRTPYGTIVDFASQRTSVDLSTISELGRCLGDRRFTESLPLVERRKMWIDSKHPSLMIGRVDGAPEQLGGFRASPRRSQRLRAQKTLIQSRPRPFNPGRL